MSILERKDVNFVVVVPWNDNDGGLCYRVGFDGVTMIEIVKRHGPMDWLPYVAVWRGDALYAEVAQHQCLTVEFNPPKASDAAPASSTTASDAVEAGVAGQRPDEDRGEVLTGYGEE